MIINNACISILPISPSGSRIAQISPDLPKKAGFFPVKIVKN